MIRNVLTLFGLVVLILVGWWVQHLQMQNSALEEKIHGLQANLHKQQMENQTLYDQYMKEKGLLNSAAQIGSNNVHELQQQLATEQEKLKVARKALDEKLHALKTAADPSAQSHIEEDNARIGQLNKQLGELNGDNKTVSERSRIYREQTLQTIRQQRQDNDGQLQRTRAAIQELQVQIRLLNQSRDSQKAAKLRELHAQIDALQTQRIQQEELNRELQQKAKNSEAAINHEVQSEQEELKHDRDDLQTKLREAHTDLDHWQQLKKAQGQTKQSEDVQVRLAEQAVAAQNQKIQELQRTLDTLNRSVPSPAK